MTDIRPMGHLLRTDSDGFLINESSPSKVISPWAEAVEFTKQAYLIHLGERIHSLYLVGSVSRGMAVDGISDIDTFAVLNDSLKKDDLAWKKVIQPIFQEKFPFASGVEIDAFALRDVLEGDTMHYGIKVRGFCLYGEDLAPRIAPFKPNIKLAQYLKPSLRAMIEDYLIRINIAEDEDEAKSLCRSLMKWFVRAGMILVIPRVHTHTQDLYPSYQCFIQFYPEKDDEMRQALQWVLDPILNPSEVFVRDFGGWLGDELERELG